MSETDARRIANLNSGWFEGKQKDARGDEKAPEHVIAATKGAINQMAPLKVPMVTIDRKPDVTVAPGWNKTDNGYVFEKTLNEIHTIDNYIKWIIKGELKGNHASLVLWVYDKDITQLSELQEKAGILEAKLASFVVSDPEYICVANELHDILYKVKELKKELQPEVFDEIKLEETYHDVGYEEGRFEKWQSEFMSKANTTTNDVEMELKRKDPVKI
ncbi:MAG: hypothetical protein PHW62_00755 [Candidatus Ratteibacteria bacterium]|nr:hypothetical protein [Candidatus Ratteibacteria bacterium]